MFDLFGDTITTPTIRPKSDKNAAMGFAEFWAAWPSGTRKVAKQQCCDKWARYDCCEVWQHIVAHVEWLKTQDDWLKDNGAFICAPLVYLNQQRWVDWEPPKPVNRGKSLSEILDERDKMAVPMPEHIREKLKQLRRNT
jgi:hypothetical protein